MAFYTGPAPYRRPQNTHLGLCSPFPISSKNSFFFPFFPPDLFFFSFLLPLPFPSPSCRHSVIESFFVSIYTFTSSPVYSFPGLLPPHPLLVQVSLGPLQSSLASIGTQPLSTQPLSVLSHCQYSASVGTQPLSVLSLCRYSVTVGTQPCGFAPRRRYSGIGGPARLLPVAKVRSLVTLSRVQCPSLKEQGLPEVHSIQ